MHVKAVQSYSYSLEEMHVHTTADKCYSFQTEKALFDDPALNSDD